MTKVEAIIRPDKMEDVKAGLDELGVKGMTFIHVMGAGKQRGRTEYYRGQEYVVNLLDKIKVETVVKDEVVEAVVETIIKFASTGEIGDGKIFVSPVSSAIRIRTGEQGDSALG